MENEFDTTRVTKLETDLLLLFYNFSDQFGVVDMKTATIHAKKRLGVDIPQRPFTLKQKHIDFLMARGKIPDTRYMMSALSEKPKLPPQLGEDTK
jgi:hypothetical protein